jgi:hypothetical protein
MWKGNLMHMSGRLVLIRTTLSVIPTYTAISIGMLPRLRKAQRRIMTAFLWTGSDAVSGGKCLIVWSQVQRLLPLGDLGVLDLSRFGMTLKLHWLWLHYPTMVVLAHKRGPDHSGLVPSLDVLPGQVQNIDQVLDRSMA